MAEFKKIDNELNELWGDALSSEKGQQVQKAIGELSRVEVPLSLSFNLKSIAQKQTQNRLVYAPIVFASIAALLLFISISHKEEKRYIAFDDGASDEGAIISEYEEDGIFDESLINLEKLLWSV